MQRSLGCPCSVTVQIFLFVQWQILCAECCGIYGFPMIPQPSVRVQTSWGSLKQRMQWGLDLTFSGPLPIGRAVPPVLSFDTATLAHPLRWARWLNRQKGTGQPIVDPDPDVIEIRLMIDDSLLVEIAITCDQSLVTFSEVWSDPQSHLLAWTKGTICTLFWYHLVSHFGMTSLNCAARLFRDILAGPSGEPACLQHVRNWLTYLTLRFVRQWWIGLRQDSSTSSWPENSEFSLLAHRILPRFD